MTAERGKECEATLVDIESLFKEADIVSVHLVLSDRSRGLGLGLALVDRTAQLLGHPIGVRSVLDRGSVFWVEAPLAEGGEIAAETVAHGDTMVAVSEDGHIVLIPGAAGARGRIETCQRPYPRLRQRAIKPDLIIADHRLEGVETGIHAGERLHAALGGVIPAIIITGDTAPDRLREASLGGHRLLHKPVRPETLLRIVGEAIPTRDRRLAS